MSSRALKLGFLLAGLLAFAGPLMTAAAAAEAESRPQFLAQLFTEDDDGEATPTDSGEDQGGPPPKPAKCGFERESVSASVCRTLCKSTPVCDGRPIARGTCVQPPC